MKQVPIKTKANDSRNTNLVWLSFGQNVCILCYKPTFIEGVIMLLHLLSFGLIGKVWLIQPLHAPNSLPNNIKVKWLITGPFIKTKKEK